MTEHPHSAENHPLLSIVWEGSQFVHHSLAVVNREICLALIDSGRCDLSIVPYEPHTFGVEQDPKRFSLIQERFHRKQMIAPRFYIRHQWPPRFKRPDASWWIVMQPYEYGSMPAEWLPHFQEGVDEIWVYSSHNRDCYIHDGVDPDKIAVIPLAVDTQRFHPEVPPYGEVRRWTAKKLKFLFVGGTIWRKGIDVLLDAYTRAFSQEDDVALIIKDMGVKSFYGDQGTQSHIRELQQKTNAPEIIYLKDPIPDRDLPGLYTACDCLVHPYRGEGFGLPIAEAMACGLPVILTQGGAPDDFTSPETSYYLSAEWMKVKLDVQTIRPAWVLNPDASMLIERLHSVASNPPAAREKGIAAARTVRSRLSWKKSAETIIERLVHLDSISAHSKIRKTGVLQRKTQEPEWIALEMNRRGEELFRDGNEAAAELRFLWSAEADPGYAEPYNNLAVLYWHRGKPEAAVQLLTFALERAPRHPQAIENLHSIARTLGKKA